MGLYLVAAYPLVCLKPDKHESGLGKWKGILHTKIFLIPSNLKEKSSVEENDNDPHHLHYDDDHKSMIMSWTIHGCALAGSTIMIVFITIK